MRSAVILLVEDDFLNRRLTKKVLLESGYQVVEAKHGQQALELVTTHRLDLAILDINLGEGQVDGIRLSQLLQASRPLPFLYLTAYESTQVIRDAVTTAPYSYLTKPFKNSDLIASVELALIKSAPVASAEPTIVVRDEQYKIDLPLAAINYIESSGNYVLVHTDAKTYRCRSTLGQLQAWLPGAMFIQTHRAYIVNKHKIRGYTSGRVVVGTTELPLSKKDVLG